MRKLLVFGFMLSLLAFTACQDDGAKVADEAGNIAGMGDAIGELQYSDFNLPDGISIVGDIEGTIEDEQSATALKSTSGLRCYGSGGRFVKLNITLTNTSRKKRTAWLPAGLLFEVQNADRQNAILLCWTYLCFDAGETRTFELFLYCLNRGLPGSLLNTKYKMLGVTKSRRMNRIIEICGLKKINIEHYSQLQKAGLKSAVDYDAMVEQLQNIVWAETNDNGITAVQEEYLSSLPDLEEGALPPTILDEDFLDNPPYWEEYSEQ